MAKGNIFQGMARGSVGDLTMTRRGGQQITTVRVRVVSQPNTLAQKVEKAVMSTTSLAYKAMKKVINKTFEGYKTGTETQSEFTRRNISIIRGNLESLQTRVVEYKSSWPVCNPYLMSDGSLNGFFTMLGRLTAQPYAGETLKEWCTRIDLKRSDVFAVCMLNAAPYYVDEQCVFSCGQETGARHMATKFGYYQFKISAQAIASDALCSSVNFADIWDVSHADVRLLMSGGWNSQFDFDAINLAYGGSIRVLMSSVIRMRSKNRLRSRAVMTKVYEDVDLCGILYPYIDAAWNVSASELSSSDTVLAGSGFNDVDSGGGGSSNKKLLQLQSKYFKENNDFFYVLLGSWHGGIQNPVFKATYAGKEGNKLVYTIQAIADNQGNLCTSDEYGRKTWVPVTGSQTSAEVGYMLAETAAQIANDAENTTGWKTQYKASTIYNADENVISNDSLVVSYRSYNKDA